MSAEPKLYDVTRRVFFDERPFRVHLGTAEQRHTLLCFALDFYRQPRTHSEVRALLEEHTDCPKPLIQALEMTVTTELRFRLGTHEHRLVTDNFGKRAPGEPFTTWITEDGLRYLQAHEERAA